MGSRHAYHFDMCSMCRLHHRYTPLWLATLQAQSAFHAWRRSFVFAVSGSTTSAYNDFDKVMLGHYGMTVANGIYSMAYRVINIATMPIQSIEAAASLVSSVRERMESLPCSRSLSKF